MYTIILAGGSGIRLFPLSRSSYPKQFIPLFNEESLFQKSVRRALLFSKPEEIYIVTNDKHKFLVEDQLKTVDANCHILTEPCGKNTLPAITYAMNSIFEVDPDGVVLILPSDQLILIDEAYMDTIHTAEKLAETRLVTFGVTPTSPHTGYGYISPGKALGKGFYVNAFVEKPNLEMAIKYIKRGYLWNAGIFCFSAKLFKSECQKFAPNVAEAFTKEPDEAYRITPNISIDYGLMEKTDNAAVVPLKSSWNDLGSFDALYAVSEKNMDGNVVRGEYTTPDGKNNLIISDKIVATIGFSDIAVVDTADALLICPKDQAQRVGEIVSLLQINEDERALVHTTVHRPWGHYTILLKGERFQIKRITVNPHQRLSLQYHYHRSEHWVVVSGTAEVTNDGKYFFVRTGESTFVPSGIKHRLSNPGMIPLEVIEVQIGELLTEEDIIRCQDDYKRD